MMSSAAIATRVGVQTRGVAGGRFRKILDGDGDDSEVPGGLRRVTGIRGHGAFPITPG